MKLAEALLLRADRMRTLEQLRERIQVTARYQEGEEPLELIASRRGWVWGPSAQASATDTSPAPRRGIAPNAPTQPVGERGRLSCLRRTAEPAATDALPPLTPRRACLPMPSIARPGLVGAAGFEPAACSL